MKNNKQMKTKSSKIKVNFNGGMLTNYSGVLPFNNFMNKLGIDDLLKEELTIKECHNTKFTLNKIIKGTILGLLSGQNRINKIESFTHDPLVQNLLNIDKQLDEDTIGSKYKKFNQKHTNEIIELLGKLSNKVHKKINIGEDILDIDSSVRTIYGKQEGAEKGFNHQKGKRSYHPLLAFLENSRECLLSWLRPGDSYTSNNADEFLRQAFAIMPKTIKKLMVRGDSGFFSDKIISAIEEKEDFTYLIKVKLKNLKNVLSIQQWDSIPGMADWEMSDFDYQAKGWEKPRHFYAVRRLRRVISKNVLFPLHEYDYYCYVSNIEESPLYLHKLYGDRGTSENWIEAVKNQMFAGCLSTQSFWANEALWLMSIMAYNLSIWFRLLTDKRSWREEPNTFRYWFIQLAGKIVRSGRQIYLKMYKAYHYKSRWREIQVKVDLLSFA